MSAAIDAAPVPDWLTTPIEFEDRRGFRLSRRMMRVTITVVAGLLLWAAAAPIRELSLARGQLVPASQIRPVQHLEGGIVQAILVEQGQAVEKDQPILHLQPVSADSELAALRTRAQVLLLQKERAKALLSEQPFDLPKHLEHSAALTAEHKEVYERRRDHRAKERRLLLVRIAQRKAEIASLSNEIVLHRKLVAIYKEQLGMREPLSVTGNISKKQMLDTESVFQQARVQLQVTEGKLAAAEQALQEAEAALVESDAQAHKLWSEEKAKASSELAEVQEQIRKLEDRVERLVVRAPIKGRVQHVVQRSQGEVVRPGETIARVVPLGDPLLAEVFVKPEDIAAVKAGDRAELKVSAYDFTKYGRIRGEVADVSPSTVEGDDKRSYYKVMIRFDPRQPDQYGRDWNLQPGMTVDAEIVSASRSLLHYLLKPVYRGVAVAFSER